MNDSEVRGISFCFYSSPCEPLNNLVFFGGLPNYYTAIRENLCRFDAHAATANYSNRTGRRSVEFPPQNRTGFPASSALWIAGREDLYRELIHRKRLAFDFSRREDPCVGSMFQSGQLVRVNLAGLQAEGVMFQAAVTDAVGHIVKQSSEQPPKYLVKLLFSFRGVNEIEVPSDRIHAG